MIKKCFLCHTELTKKKNSKEHIIKNSIGGNKSVIDFICDDCNNRRGNEWDCEIDLSFGKELSILFDIKRDRGKTQKIMIKDNTTKENYWLNNKELTKINPDYMFNKNSGKIIITSFSEKRGKQFLQQLKKEKKVPTSTTFHSTEEIKEYEEINTSINFNIPGLNSNFSKSIVKSALALLSTFNNGMPLSFCGNAKEFLKDNENPCLKFWYENDPILNRPFSIPLHCVHVFNEGSEINAYIELFGIARYFIHLSDYYEGEKINLTYAINPKEGKEIDLLFNFNQKESLHLNPANINCELLEEVEFEKLTNLIFYKSIEKNMYDLSKGHTSGLVADYYQNVLMENIIVIC